MTVTRKEGTYTAHPLTLEELVEVVVGRIKPDYSLFFETEDPCLIMLDAYDLPVLWANGLRKIPYRFESVQDFLDFCDRIAGLLGLSSKPRKQPSELAYIEHYRLRRFRHTGKIT